MTIRPTKPTRAAALAALAVTAGLLAPGAARADQPGSTPLSVATSPAASDDQVTLHQDPRVGTYRQRQAIRDAYRGQIDEAAFNESLNAGLRLEAALQYATAAKHGAGGSVPIHIPINVCGNTVNPSIRLGPVIGNTCPNA